MIWKQRVVVGLLLAAFTGCDSKPDTDSDARGPTPVGDNGARALPQGHDGEIRGTGSAQGTPSTAAPASAPGASAASAAGPSFSGTDRGTATPGGGMSTPRAPAPASAGASPAPMTSAAGSAAPSPEEDAGVEALIVDEQTNIAAGTLTAGTWDDNQNFDRFERYRDRLLADQTPGTLPTTDKEHREAHDRFSQARDARTTLDVALVIDTTGSMGDEIAYLQAEFLAISRTIERDYPNAQQRWSLIVYRDTTDEYVVRWFDFRDDASEFREKLAAQSATGGGDFPEAPNAALERMSELAWRTDDDTARLAFWVADAPHHAENAAATASAIRKASELGIHLYPVASSGVDELTELSMRSAAQLTGGRYLFLTDDSGVGGAHKEPSIPCYFVTKLDDAIVRMVDIELSGTYREPEESEIIRADGNPRDGACVLDSGNATSF